MRSNFCIRRHLKESFWMGVATPEGERDVKITIIEITRQVVRLGIEAPREVDILLVQELAARGGAPTCAVDEQPSRISTLPQ